MFRLLLALLIAAPAAGQTCDAVWHDAARDRDLPVRIRLPDGTAKVPLILFSPGLGGGIAGGSLWAKAWTDRGLAVVHLEHPGSDAAAYRAPGTPQERRARIRAAASAQQLHARVGDVGFILDELARRPREGQCNLARLDLTRIGIAGHSMGAWTAQGVAGQRFLGKAPFRDARIDAAIALSPSALTQANFGEAFGGITIPFLSITGTEDGVPARRGEPTPESDAKAAAQRLAAEAQRIGPYRGMPPGQKYLIVFKDGDHMVFAGNLRSSPTATDIHIHDAVISATNAFWGAELLGDKTDAATLKTLKLTPSDRFESK
ncbi:hypothetical protein GCM10011529_25670 [Polymorphobacter glacialis]|uniref:Dienelactone hydrolase n=1 Tax=Sandarakinorhabdus glacialis TaxID=1614636 RepID=A0A917EAB6_9SPHN|nr:dienelactone hydrolase [Polymorphobacter glacialis]GGE18034.1 hypothetical protein GCM10011529_25670 [Polymorphobacter glacialis]